MRLILFLCFLFLVVCDPVLITTTKGKIEGYKTLDFLGKRIWKGIPFASPPIGNLRFEAPIPHEPWSGVLDTKDYGHDCLQVDGNSGMASNTAEDCLYLNIFAPDNIKGELAVMVFNYGGSFSYGSSSFDLYDGEKILREADDVIIVTLNYRLGPLGFLAATELSESSVNSDKTSGNYGLLDQAAALQWVQDNIEFFGGNKSQVSMWGESAGAGSTSCHLVMPSSNGLFQQVIMESGPEAMWISKPFGIVQTSYDMIANNFKCNGTAAQQRSCLQNVDAKLLMKQHVKDPARNWCNKTDCCSKFGDAITYLEWAPVIDGKLIPNHPMVLAAEGKINPSVRAALFGTNLNEGTLFVPDLSHDATVAQYENWIKNMFVSLADEVKEMYPASNYSTPWWAAARTITDSFMACPARKTATDLTLKGVDTYLYQFVHQWDETKFKKDLGVFHGSELPFVFHVGEGFVPLPDGWYIPVILTPEELVLSDRMVKYWTCFARTGNPSSCYDDVKWPKYEVKSDYNQRIGLSISTTQYLKQEKCNYWNKK